MRRDHRIKNLKKLLTARGIYDSTPDTNIERLNKEIVDLAITKIPAYKQAVDVALRTKKPELIKELDKKKREKKEKPIRTSLLCSRR